MLNTKKMLQSYEIAKPIAPNLLKNLKKLTRVKNFLLRITSSKGKLKSLK